MFRGNSELSDKQKKGKLRGWAAAIGLLLVLIEVILTGLFVYKLIELDMLPMNYLITIIVILAVLFLYNLISQFTSAHILGKILAIIMSGVLLFLYLFASKFVDVLNKVSETGVNVDVVDVCVLATDRAITIDDCAAYTFGHYSAAENANITAAFQDIREDTGSSVNTVDYNSWGALVDALYENTEIQAVVINDSMLNIITQERSDFLDKIRIVKTYKYSRQVSVGNSNVNVKNDSFIIYVSGISSEDGADSKLANNALSDVNILAVVNPNTRQILLVTTPRDSYIPITNNNGYTGFDKLTHAGIYGIEQSIAALQNLYGIKINYYVKINFTGAIDVVDALGGITINSEVEFTNGDEAAPIAYHFVVGDNECDGAKTIAFTRERLAFLNGDFQRGRNQAAAIKAIINKATSTAILTRYSAVLDAVSDSFLTNIPNTAISELVKAQLADSTPWNIQTFSIGGGTDTCYLEVTNLYNGSVVKPSYEDINIAIKLMESVQQGNVFDLDEYVAELKSEPSQLNAVTEPVYPTQAYQSTTAAEEETTTATTEPTTQASTESATKNTNATTKANGSTSSTTKSGQTNGSSTKATTKANTNNGETATTKSSSTKATTAAASDD
jgi:LCP family protein required for cell wall assembly